MYRGYQATLLRNVPSAMLRFALYEEFRQLCIHKDNSHDNDYFEPLAFVGGALAGAMASGFMTPVDVIKTRITTQTVPTRGFVDAAQYIVRQHGVRGLYAGARSRMVWSGAFSAIGFGTFEACKSVLGVSTRNKNTSDTSVTARRREQGKKQRHKLQRR